MQGRDQTGVQQLPTKRGKVSTARMVSILGGIPRNQPKLIINIRDDMEAVIAHAISSVKSTLQGQIRAYGHYAITEDLEVLQKNPDEFPVIAHQSYIKRVSAEIDLELCTASVIRKMFSYIEFSDDDIRMIMHKAAEQVEVTQDEPKLIIKTINGDLVVTFAT